MTTKNTINKSIATSLQMTLRMIRAASSNPERMTQVLELVEELARPLPDNYRLDDFIAHDAARLALWLHNRSVPEDQRQEVISIVLGEKSCPISVHASQGVTA
ncbi:hypothetical protein [Pseudescherichia sp.]|uniref:hypothetical protein n=1 Tax=Pseudescherichia sp. TaxID=2055881 RepID=UPI00289828BD|nr:hypothetical protein [Pseudescherichia sp.]